VAVFGSVMTLGYALTLVLPESAMVPTTARDSLDEALRAAQSLSPEVASQLRAAGSAAFGHALQAVLVGVGVLWIATGVAIIASSSRTERPAP
jgi:DHA2 family multidrug resistance protein-like MFS transporter